jgi:hypothetical protein
LLFELLNKSNIKIFQEQIDVMSTQIKELFIHNKTVEKKLDKIDNDIETMKSLTYYDTELKNNGSIALLSG